tara:strand:+ start:54 stop:767 length:714 start_codon:yes stop_codon:yes gene_type:complete
MTYDFADMDTKSLKKIIVAHNKQYKEMLLSLKGGRAAILPLVEKEFIGKMKSDGNVDVKHKKGLSKYTVNMPGTKKRAEEDAKFKKSRARDLENRRKKVIRNKGKAKAADKKSQAKGAKKGVGLVKALNKVKGVKEKALTGATRMKIKKRKSFGMGYLAYDMKKSGDKKAYKADKRSKDTTKAAKKYQKKRTAVKKIQKVLRGNEGRQKAKRAKQTKRKAAGKTKKKITLKSKKKTY